MDKKELEERLEELVAAIENLARSNHNPSKQLKRYVRDLFDRLLDDVTNQV